jgi:NADH-ubiquinone oxidoreductase chain 1
LFLGGYLLINTSDLFNLIDFIFSNVLFIDWVFYWRSYIESIFNNPSLEGLLFGLNLGLKSSIMIFTFIWARASFPRIRFDQLMAFCWTVLLPVVFALVILVPCILYSYNILPVSINLF